VLNDGTAHVYSIDSGFREVESFPIPEGTRGVRGVEVCPAKATMYFAVGGDGGAQGSGSLVAINLVTKAELWSHSYSTGVDSMAISRDCSKIYMPVGELASSGEWKILSTVNGSEQGAIQTPGTGPHDGVLSADGKVLLLGDRNYNHLSVYNTATGKLQEQVGPLVGGVRPLTIDGTDTLSFTTATGFTGFQVGSLLGSAPVLWTENFGGTCPFTTCSHGISITPDSKEVAVIDSAHKAVQFWNVEGAGSGKSPTHMATVPVTGLSGEKSGCAYDCLRAGWVQHSYDGRYVFVGDSGDVISTATHKVVAHIAYMENTRETIEVDWENGVPIATTERAGVGHVG
jgi:DNA-binding beta-propeller fold protein YncE